VIRRTATESDRGTRPGPPARRLLTVPNVLCAVRLAGSPVLGWLAWADRPGWCLGLFAFLSLTDWLDGKLAVLLRQQTEFGARLDTVADVTFYAGTLLALAALRADLVRQEGVWIGLAVGSYAVSVAAALAKYRRAPSYHTRMAKTSWLLAFVAVVAVFAGWSVWAVRLALLGVFLTNVEATLITLRLPEWRANVPSVFHARRAGDRGGGPC
jgi:cardiolipin synthase (CMP-forming)